VDLFAYLPQLNTILARHDVVLAYLFGSQARGEAGPLSDVDVAVLLASDAPPERWGDAQLNLIGELTSLFRRDDVDVVVLNRATPLLAWEVVRYGHRIYVSSPAARIDFETKALRDYVETKPLRQMQQRRLAEWIEERRAVRQPSSFVW